MREVRAACENGAFGAVVFTHRSFVTKPQVFRTESMAGWKRGSFHATGGVGSCFVLLSTGTSYTGSLMSSIGEQREQGEREREVRVRSGGGGGGCATGQFPW